MVSLGGFGLRLVLVSVLTVVFAGMESIDVVAFALAYVASFLVFLGLQVWAVSRMQARAGPPAGGDEREDGST
jgi:cytosine/uracil/thiamine/allantoin permease